MAFIKVGDAQPILTTHEGDTKLTDEETQIALEAAKQAAKNIGEDGFVSGNKTELNKKSSK